MSLLTKSDALVPESVKFDRLSVPATAAVSTVTLTGVGGHGAMPQRAADPVVAAAVVPKAHVEETAEVTPEAEAALQKALLRK